MPLLIRVEDFKSRIIDELIDINHTLKDILDYCYLNPSLTKVFKYIDLYDDTVLNSLQIVDLIKDIEFLKNNNQIFNQEKIQILEELNKLCKIALEKPHIYLKFYGD